MPREEELAGPLTRRNHGRNHSYRFGDVKVPGVTTVTGVLDKPGLIKWAAEEAAEVVANATKVEQGKLAVDIEDLWADLRSKDNRLPAEPTRVDLTAGLTWRHRKTRDEAANRGTEVHDIADRMVKGESPKVPPLLVGHVDSYLAWHEAMTPTDALSEVSVGSRRLGGWGGTFDLVATVPDLGRCLIDLKTNRSGPFAETALQLAGYRYSDVWLDGDGVEHPTDELGIEWCGVLWLRGDGWSLYPYRVGSAEFALFSHLRRVYALWTEPYLTSDRPDLYRTNTLRGEPIEPDQLGEVGA